MTENEQEGNVENRLPLRSGRHLVPRFVPRWSRRLLNVSSSLAFHCCQLWGKGGDGQLVWTPSIDCS